MQFRSDSGNTLRQFHHPWCNSHEHRKSYVKERLQRPPNVLLSGPFKKVSQRPTERDFIQRPEVRSSGADQRQTGNRLSSSNGRMSFSSAPRELLPENRANEPARRFTGDAGKDSYDGICNFAGFGSQSLAPDSRSSRKEGDPPVVRDLAQAHALQPRRGPHALRARAFAGVPAHRRQVRRPDSGSDRSAVAGVRRRELCDRGRRSVDSAAAQGWRLRPGSGARAHGAAAGAGARARAGALRLVHRGAAELALHLRQLSSSATATSLPAPPRWPWPSGLRAPTIRSSCMAAWAWARPT